MTEHPDLFLAILTRVILGPKIQHQFLLQLFVSLNSLFKSRNVFLIVYTLDSIFLSERVDKIEVEVQEALLGEFVVLDQIEAVLIVVSEERRFEVVDSERGVLDVEGGERGRNKLGMVNHTSFISEETKVVIVRVTSEGGCNCLSKTP